MFQTLGVLPQGLNAFAVAGNPRTPNESEICWAVPDINSFIIRFIKKLQRKQMKEIDRDFLEAGETEGIQFWRIQSVYPMTCLLVKRFLHDSQVFLVLQTRRMLNDTFTHNLHIWIGANAPEDDVTHAVRHAALLDLKLRRRATLHWERQNQECDLFMSYFSPALHYLPERYFDYYFCDVIRSWKNMLFTVHFSKKNIVRVRQVKCEMSSLNKRDPCILVTEDTVYVLPRGDCNPDLLVIVADEVLEGEQFRLKPFSLLVLDKMAEIQDWDAFYINLGWKDLNTFPTLPDGEVNEVEATQAELYEILRNRKGAIYYKHMRFPLQKEALDSQSLYILTNGKGDISLWIGRKNQDRNKVKLYGLAKIQEFMSHYKWPSWTHMTIIPEGIEPLSFKEYFRNWIEE